VTEQFEPDLMDHASRAAMLVLHAEWDSKECPICKTVKWAYHPFCRGCSIRLQRMHLMAGLVPWRGLSGDEIMQGRYTVPSGKVIKLDSGYATLTQLWRWFRCYDIARDYLWTERRWESFGRGKNRAEVLAEEAEG
jgi:hypothetical protein